MAIEESAVVTRRFTKRDHATAEERFWAKVDRTSTPDGCWLWTAGKSHGYGTFAVKLAGRLVEKVRAHHFAWLLDRGPLRHGLVLHHSCWVKLCVRPSHLVPMTKAEHRRIHTEAQTHCKRGHEFAPGSFVVKAGGRLCLPCKRLRERKEYRVEVGSWR